LFAVLFACRSAAAGDTAAIEVVATTTHIGTIVSAVGGDKVKVLTLVPGGMCPGHFDIEPGAMKTINRAQLFIRHDWEHWADGVFSPGGGRVKTVAVPGSWMLPETNAKAAGMITAMLVETDPRNGTYYERNLRDYHKTVAALSDALRKKTPRFTGIEALCEEQQKEFLELLGFKIIKTYGRAEDLRVRGMADLMEAAGKAKVRLVIDNLQSGAGAGEEIARALRCGHVTLSNFPVDGSYAQTLERNLRSLEKALYGRLDTAR
jgi:zinc transport system substrate-binding protein